MNLNAGATRAKAGAGDPAAGDLADSRPLTGNEAIARGAWEAGITVAAAYPGTPSTEIMESLAEYPVEDVHVQWSPNEKVAVDVAIGASFAGARSFSAMKHVGLNVAADAVMSQTYIGVNGGLVLAVCDDPGIHSSQNEQDTRVFAQFARIPVLEPADADEARAFTRLAFDLSEEFDTIVILRSTTRLSHTRSAVTLGERVRPPERRFVDDPVKNVIVPAHARLRHPLVIEREAKLRDYFAAADLYRWEEGRSKVGIVTHGIVYNYVKEAMPEAAVLKIGASYPLPIALVRRFYEAHDHVIVVEELEPVIETEMRAHGLAVEGKKFIPRVGELSTEVVRQGLETAGVLAPSPKVQESGIEPLVRPPVLCAGCPHTGAYMALRALNARVTGDIGCYTLAAMEPLRSIDTTVSMGSSIGNAIGFAMAGTESKPIVATIGDSTFLHAGVPPLIDAVYNNADITVVLLDNHITAMTGGQDHPGTGRTLRGEVAPQVNYEVLARAVGVEHVRKVDGYDLAALYQACREATEHRGVSMVIVDRPCVLDPVKLKGKALAVREEACTACQSCMNLGCPALSWSDVLFEGHHKVKIDEVLCIGCTLCAQICPTDCIQPLHG